MSTWHIWVIKQNKFDAIKHFLDNDVKEVEDVFFPTVLKECRVGTKRHKRRVPLYSGYLFLRYSDPENKVHYKIRSNPFVTNYVGPCHNFKVEDMKLKEEWNVLNKKVETGDRVEIVAGPMKKCKGRVHSISGNKVTIKVNLFDREIDCTISSEDLEIIDK